ncbi:MAG: DUF1616 domain-containing protein [Thermoproteota archaeon]
MKKRCMRCLVLILLIVLLTDLTILSPISREEPFIFLRVALIILLIAFLPGFCIVRLLYPCGELERIEELGYSLMISLFVSPLTALVMSFLPSGFGTVEDPAPLLGALSAMTVILAFAAFVWRGEKFR